MKASLVAIVAVFLFADQAVGLFNLFGDKAVIIAEDKEEQREERGGRRTWETEDQHDSCFTSLDPEYIPPHEVTAKKMSKYLLEQIIEDPLDSYPHRAPAAPRRPTDVIFVIDSSNSLRRRSFYRGLRALEWIVNRGRSNSLYAGIVFSFGAHVEFPFVNPSYARRFLRRIQFQAGKTNTQMALEQAYSLLLMNNQSGIRENSQKKIVVLSDGHSNVEPEKTLYKAFKLKMSGAELFVIAVGKKMSGLPELMSMASTTNNHMFRVESMQGLLAVVKLIPRRNELRRVNSDMETLRRRMAKFRKQ